MAAITKGYIRRFINEKHDCVNSFDFVNATRSTPYMTVLSCSLASSSSKTKSKWEGIQHYNNIQYEFVSESAGRASKTRHNEIEVTVWRAFEIGPGEKFLWSKLKVSTDTITSIKIDSKRENYEWQDDSFKSGMFIDFLDYAEGIIHNDQKLFYFVLFQKLITQKMKIQAMKIQRNSMSI